MPMELLRQLADKEMPLALYAPADIDRLRVLRAADLVVALIPPVETMEGGAQVHKAAQVLCITPKGQEALASMKPTPLADAASHRPPKQPGSDEPPPEPVPGQDDPNPQPVEPPGPSTGEPQAPPQALARHCASVFPSP